MRRKWQEGIEGTDFLVYNWSEIQKKVGKRTHMEHQVQENKMGVLPVNRLLISMALPIIYRRQLFCRQTGRVGTDGGISGLPHSDRYDRRGYRNRCGHECNAVQIPGGKGSGHCRPGGLQRRVSGALLRRRLYAGGRFCIYPFYASQVADYPDIMEYGVEYLTVACLFCQGIYVELVFERILQATGHTVASMVTQLAGAVTNIILDPCFIFGIGPFPRMGVTGAAVATVIGQFIAAIVAVIVNQAFNKEIHVRFKACFRPSRPTIRRIYSVGIPSIIMGSIGSVMYYGMNQILLGFTATASAVFGVYFKLQSFFFMPVFGMNNATVPIIAYNYGAQKRGRMLQTTRLAAVYCAGIMLLGLAVMNLFPVQLLGIFDASEQMLTIGVPALRIISLSLVFAGVCIALGSVFQALGNGVYSMIVSLTRQMLVLLPVAWLLARTGNLNAVWWAVPIAEVASLLATLFFFVRINRKVISKVGDVA